MSVRGFNVLDRALMQAQPHRTLNDLTRDLGTRDRFALSDLRVGLANRVRPEMSPEEFTRVAQLDKQLAIAVEQGKLMEEIDFMRYDSYEDSKQRWRNLKERLSAAGAIFA